VSPGLRRAFGALAALAVLGLIGCSAPKRAAVDPVQAAKLRAQALIDSGSAAFRAGDFSASAKRYASAVVVSPDDPAAYYGLGMALAKLGRDDDARIAYAKARELTRGEVGESEDLPHEIKYRRTVHP
jgi:Flp pilus assembly protein TadD